MKPGSAHRVLVEATAKRALASALDWPGWARGGRDRAAALAALAAYAPRMSAVARRAGLDLNEAAAVDVVAEVNGGANTDFGVPGAEIDEDRSPVAADDVERTILLVEAAWAAFDSAVASAPPGLRKGPRGGGRDRDKILAHVIDAEGEYARKLRVKLPEAGHHDAVELAARRAVLVEALRAAADGPPPNPGEKPSRWTFRYGARRIAWHVLDHAWEIEDRIPG